jgi:hypothetical protein
MAKANKIVKHVPTTVTKTVMVEETVGITLELSVEEAEAIAAVLYRVGGDPNTSRRGLTDRVSNALHGAGVKLDTEGISTTANAVYFTR